MKTLVIMRFGIPQVLPHERTIFDTIGAETKVGVVGKFGQIGYIGIFKTGFSPDEVTHMFNLAAEEHGDTLPVMVTELKNLSANLGAVGFDSLIEKYKEAEQLAQSLDVDGDPGDEQPEDEPTIKCTLSLDDLLDKISAVGTKNLTQAEHERLQELTKNLH